LIAGVCDHEEIGQQQAALSMLHKLQQEDPCLLLPAHDVAQVIRKSKKQNFRFGVRPAAPPPAPPLPLTPQGCLICKSGSLCKFWGRGVRWAGLRTLV